MENLRVFANKEFGQINVILVNNKEYFEAIEIAQILGYSNPRDAVIRLCQREGVVFSDVGVVTGKKTDNTDIVQYVSKKFIDEGNMYRLIMKSKLPSAIKFEKWIMDEVILSIRKCDAITIGQFAKVLNNNNIMIGINRLFSFLREQGYLIKSGKEENMPKQAYVEQGLFLSTTTLVTGKGQMYFLEILEILFIN